MDPWLEAHLVCPRDFKHLTHCGDTLVCSRQHAYPVVDGIPIMLLDDVAPTHGACSVIPDAPASAEPLSAGAAPEPSTAIDPYVQEMVAATCGLMYRPLVRRLRDYPIPTLRLPAASGHRFLDVGCNWGRWCVSAARRGYAAVGIDPSFDAICAARRVALQLGLTITYVVADGRYLPFTASSFDAAFSYSVLQHFDKGHARRAIESMARALRGGGTCLVQMPNVYGLRNLYHQARMRLRPPQIFDVRYWTPTELRRTFEELVGPCTLSVDGFFSLNAQRSDIRMLPLRFRSIVAVSEFLRELSQVLTPMTYAADSLYLRAVRQTA